VEADEIEQDVSLLRMEYALVLDAAKAAQALAQAARERVEAALQTQFQARVRDEMDRTGSFNLTDAVTGGVPCTDCLAVVTMKSRPVHVFSLRSPDRGRSWGADARCGRRVEDNLEVSSVDDGPAPPTLWR
jgi:hypothetical protein